MTKTIIIDQEVQRMFTEQYGRTKQLLKKHQTALEYLTQQLLKTETVDGAAVKQDLIETEKAQKLDRYDTHAEKYAFQSAPHPPCITIHTKTGVQP